MKNWKNQSCFFLFWLLFIPSPLYATETALFSDGNLLNDIQNESVSKKPGIFLSGVGEGFRTGTKVMGLSVGVTDGLFMLGSAARHDLALTSVSYGQMIGNVKGVDQWYQGNWELRVELFGGAQFNPETRSLIGVTPHLQYHFATGTRLIPYIDVGAGVSLTEIREPDLGGAFEFNLQAITGVNYFVQDKLSINIAIQYLHLSSAGIYKPNIGVNTVGCFLGVQWFF
jgi:lipid A 3-O-deacylase